MKTIIKDTFDLLTFRIGRDRMLAFGWSHLIFGFICVWIVGIGRNWDNPSASIFQHLGVGSVIYVFLLALLLWLLIMPLVSAEWSYFYVATFVSLVAPPAILYAIPFEMFVSVNAANLLNLMLLSIVSIWRVILLFYFLSIFALLPTWSKVFAAMLPLSLIVIVIFILNIEELVLSSMSGIRENSPNDASNGILILSFLFAVVIFPISLAGYVWSIWRAGKDQNLSLTDQ